MKQTEVDIVVPCLNEEQYIEKCILSVLNQEAPGIAISLFVVDGMSTDRTRSIVKRYENEFPQKVTLVDNLDRVTPVALNKGILSGKAEVVTILGAHAEIYPNFVRENMKLLEDHPDCACVGGVLHHIDENAESGMISKAMSSKFGVGNVIFRTGGTEGYADTVAFGAYRRSVLDEIGLFDTDLVRNQDDEMNFRITNSGYKIWFSPKVESKYYVRASVSKLKKQYQQYGYWKVYVNQKHKAITTIRQLIPLLFVLFLLSSILGLFSTSFACLWLIGFLIYMLVGFAFAMKAAQGISEAMKIMKVFFILHVSYGWGYLEGIWHFIILRKTPKAKHAKLSR
ncbi:MAG: glycosyltransferase family 2 protein [Flavobacteriales bacterium]